MLIVILSRQSIMKLLHAWMVRRNLCRLTIMICIHIYSLILDLELAWSRYSYQYQISLPSLFMICFMYLKCFYMLNDIQFCANTGGWRWKVWASQWNKCWWWHFLGFGKVINKMPEVVWFVSSSLAFTNSLVYSFILVDTDAFSFSVLMSCWS
jgi:hypothetical protein